MRSVYNMDAVMIIENTDEAKLKFANYGWGQSEEVLTMKHIQALVDGKAIGICDGEYTTILTLQDNLATKIKFIESVPDRSIRVIEEDEE
jgi:hypothetical protein